jgi:hypothetical protein
MTEVNIQHLLDGLFENYNSALNTHTKDVLKGALLDDLARLVKALKNATAWQKADSHQQREQRATKDPGRFHCR